MSKKWSKRGKTSKTPNFIRVVFIPTNDLATEGEEIKTSKDTSYSYVKFEFTHLTVEEFPTKKDCTAKLIYFSKYFCIFTECYKIYIT